MIKEIKKLNTMNLRTLLTKIFLVIYLILLLPHFFEMPLSVKTVSILILGLLFAIRAHQSRHKILTSTFLVLHMVLELPHMIEHVGHAGLGVILGHGLHIIFDLVFLYTLTKSVRYFIFFLFIILILGTTVNSLSIEMMSETRPFVLGGVLGCIAMHLIFQKLYEKTSYPR